jgi:hypothetical protein
VPTYLTRLSAFYIAHLSNKQAHINTKPAVMKKSLLIMGLMLICFSMKVFAGGNDECFVKVGDKVYIGNDLKMGLVYTKLYLEDGSMTKFRNKDITAYRHHDKMYMLLPVICERNDTLCMAMMQYINTKAEYSIFKYCCPDNGDLFFVYKDKKFYRRLNSSIAREELGNYDIAVR